VTDAWSSGTLFRGIEIILQGRSPEDAWLLAQRVCGVCTYVHGVASVRAVENAAGAAIPDNARVVRNLLMGGQYVHDHPIHFYHLHALDWVDIASALSADPAATASLASTVSSNPPAMDFAGVKNRLQSSVGSGQPGPFAGGSWGHPAYVLAPEENLLFAAHYLHALRVQVKAAKMHAILGAKNPHIQSLRVGGVTCRHDITAPRIAEFRALLTDMRSFIDNVYLPDVVYLATRYREWAALGGCQNYMSYGEFSRAGSEPADFLFERGHIMNRNLADVRPVDVQRIEEHVARSWYAGSTARPAEGETAPTYTGYDAAGRYSWLKAPRYDGQPMEVGPLARVMVSYGSGNQRVIAAVGSALSAAGLTFGQLHSTLGRVAARAIETKIVADEMDAWLNQLDTSGEVIRATTMPAVASGCGLNEAPRGSLGHWVSIADRRIRNYQMVVPSTWNLGPRDSGGTMGPVEAALIGTPVADPARPIEVLRTVHSFDPCLACAVHVVDRRKGRTRAVTQV
jgi:[NiFe] hydrogenase large subunit